MPTFQKLWADESAVVTTTDLILLSTILVIGTIVGLTTLRDQVVQELGDVATAIGHLNQSYTVAEFTTANFTAAGSSFADMSDDCEEGDEECDADNDEANEPPACISLAVGASGEQP